jgi:hypothetical protein
MTATHRPLSAFARLMPLCLAQLGLCAGMLAPAAADPLNPFAFSSQGTLNLSSGSYTIDTSGAAPVLLDAGSNILFTGTAYQQGGSFDSTIAVLDFNNIQIGSGVSITVTGANPLALLSRQDAVISGVINASGSNGAAFNQGGGGGQGGPGAGAGGAGGFGTGNGAPYGLAGYGPGGGTTSDYGLAIDSFGVGGGYGGLGGNPGIRPVYGATYGDLYTSLEAGSGGGGSGATFVSIGGGGGGGGGALELGADGMITVNGDILADGAAGGGENLFGYTGGGGSGGGLILDAPTIDLTPGAQIDAAAGSLSGGGGRILFLTDTAHIYSTGTTSIADGSPGIDVGGSVYGAPGTVDFGLLHAAPQATPEPGSLALLAGCSIAVLASLRRARKRK